jgi:hypothetical protein
MNDITLSFTVMVLLTAGGESLSHQRWLYVS